MSLLSEIKHRSRPVIGTFFGICAVGYFGFHMIYSDQGYLAWLDINKRIEAATLIADSVKLRRKVLENRVRLLNPETIDPDMLEERARLILNYGKTNEIIILDPKG